MAKGAGKRQGQEVVEGRVGPSPDLVWLGGGLRCRSDHLPLVLKIITGYAIGVMALRMDVNVIL